MNNKKLLKIISIVILLIIALVITITPVFALTPNELTGSNNVSTNEISELGNRIITIITTIGVVLSVIVIAVIGIKYMLGSAEEKAEYKKTLMPYLVGALLVFSASAVANIVYNFFYTTTTGS